MPANKYALLRYRIIDRAIRSKSHPYPSKQRLRELCEEALYGSQGEHISPSTIDKDLWAMRNEGELGYYAPIRFSKRYQGYYYEDPDYTIAEVPLTNEDLSAIRLAAQTLYQFREIPVFSQFKEAMEKILDRMSIGTSTEVNPDEVIQFERVSSYKGSEFLQTLFECCTQDRSVKIEYLKFNADQAASYEFDPYILKEYRNRWYCIGLEKSKAALRTFSLDRIVKLEVAGDADKEKKSGFNAQRFFQHSIGITVTDDHPVEVKLLISDHIAPYLQTQPIHSSQQLIETELGWLLTMEVLVTIELVSIILSFGSDVKVLAPDSLKEKVSSALRKAYDLYQK